VLDAGIGATLAAVEAALTRLQTTADFAPDETDAAAAGGIGDHRATPAAAAAIRLLVRQVNRSTHVPYGGA
jgi:hypothetical protein